jgi:hypothetical protein
MKQEERKRSQSTEIQGSKTTTKASTAAGIAMATTVEASAAELQRLLMQLMGTASDAACGCAAYCGCGSPVLLLLLRLLLLLVIKC